MGNETDASPERPSIEAKIAELEAQVQQRPEDPALLTKLASQYYQLRNFEKTADLLAEVVRLQPDHVNAWDFQGICHFELGNYEAALADFRQAISLAPENPTLYADLGDTYLELGNLEEAKAAFAQVEALAPPDDPENRQRLRLAKEQFSQE
ncbi:Hypothetical protein PBC10988_26210 [Planctomycetales bacterium 10988]|nr:Hypothetical protein PBC10988_26210 [Planctomycetales bacterium 10988]